MAQRDRNATPIRRRNPVDVPPPAFMVGQMPLAAQELNQGVIDDASKINSGVVLAVHANPLDTPTKVDQLSISVSTAVVADGSAWIGLAWSSVSGATEYEVRWKLHTDTLYQYARSTSANYKIYGLLPNVPYDVNIAAVNAIGNTSGYPDPDLAETTAKDTTAPATPASVVASAGVRSVIVTFTANTEVDLDHYVIEIYSDAGLTTLVKTFTGLATVWAYDNGSANTAYWARVKAVDTSGNSSAWSSTVTTTTGLIANSDVQVGTLTADRLVTATITAASGILADAVITTAKIAALAVTDAKINDLAVGKLTAGTLSAAVILGGSIKTAASGARVEIDSTGVRLYDSGGTVMVNLDASAGAGTFKGTVTGSTIYIPATTGDRMVMNNNVSGIGTGTLGVISFVKSADADSAPRGVIYLSSFDSTSTQLNMESRTSDGLKYARVRTTVDTVGGTYGVWFYINDGTNTPSGTVAKSSYDGTLLKFTSLSELPAHDAGFLPVAYPVGYGTVSTSTTISLPAAGGAIAIPIILTSPMKLQAAIVRNGDTTLARSWEWRLYKDDNVNTPAEVANANGTDSFTAAAASNRTSAAQSPPVYLTPGVYWLVVRNTHASNAFTLVVGPGNVFGNAQDQTKTLGSALGSTLDLITGWTKQGYMPLTALQGRVFAQTTGY